jgi:hypothetical protein
LFFPSGSGTTESGVITIALLGNSLKPIIVIKIIYFGKEHEGLEMDVCGFLKRSRRRGTFISL